MCHHCGGCFCMLYYTRQQTTIRIFPFLFFCWDGPTAVLMLEYHFFCLVSVNFMRLGYLIICNFGFTSATFMRARPLAPSLSHFPLLFCVFMFCTALQICLWLTLIHLLALRMALYNFFSHIFPYTPVFLSFSLHLLHARESE